MRVLQRQDYENLAKEAVARMVNDDIPLSDTLVKVSESMGLNPDQIKALVQVSNTLAHLDLFDRKTDGDKVVDFAPADPDAVVKKVVAGDEEPEAEAPSSLCDMHGDFPDQMGAQDEALDDVGTPAEAEADVGGPSTSPGGRQIMIIKIRKVAEELKQRKLTAALNYEEGVDKLAAEFAHLYGPSFEVFEKDAVDTHGGDAIPILSDLRSKLRLPEIQLAVFEKRARLVDTGTPEMKSFGRLKGYIEEAKACEAGQELLNSKIGSL